MNIVFAILLGLLAGFVTFAFGQYVGLTQPLLGIVAMIVFVGVAYFSYPYLGRRV